MNNTVHLFVKSSDLEYCYNIGCNNIGVSDKTLRILKSLIGNYSFQSSISDDDLDCEIGPRQTFETDWCSNAVSILRSCGIKDVEKIEISKRYAKSTQNDINYDKITKQIYESPMIFSENVSKPNNLFEINGDLEMFAKKNNLGFDKYDLLFYNKLFGEILNRNPTNIEMFDLSQSNSEHSRHHFFKGQLYLSDGSDPTNTKMIKQSKNLFEIIQEPYIRNPSNSIVAFKDNSSGIKGFKDVLYFLPVVTKSGNCGGGGDENILHAYKKIPKNVNIILTAETHNFPTGIAPFSGASTGVGGRIRDVQAFGRGGLLVAGSAGYCVGELFPKKENLNRYPIHTPRKILIEASNGASDYGNKIGEPIILGFTRAYGNPSREWIKPIMYTSGIGLAFDEHTEKKLPQVGDLIVKIGGPAYPIGMGGGSASSRNQTHTNDASAHLENIDLCAVQRGDPEMENRMNRLVESCIFLGKENPIKSIHDQGAGGTANVTKEIAEPLGANVYLDKVHLGDKSMTDMEIWCAEYQEQNTLLIDPQSLLQLQTFSKRENIPCAVIGEITNGKTVRVFGKNGDVIVDLPHTSFPAKEYFLEKPRIDDDKKSVKFQTDDANTNLPKISIDKLVKNIFQLVDVGSKRFLTTKVDRSVGGLIAQQQGVGPFDTPIANCAVIAQSFYDVKGGVTAIGEQPIKGLYNNESMGRLAVGEMLTNMMWVNITDISHIKCSVNWMWPVKNNPKEQYNLYIAAKALADMCCKLGIAIDGGKDSLSMSAKTAAGNIDAPGQVVVAGYATVENVNAKVTPDLKNQNSAIIYVDLGFGNYRLGGSAYERIVDSENLHLQSPDISLENISKLKDTFEIVQGLIKKGIVKSGHDRSDGGLLTTLVEMCIASNIGCEIDIGKTYLEEDSNPVNVLNVLFSEELGVVMEIDSKYCDEIKKIFTNKQIPMYIIGNTTNNDIFKIVNDKDTLYQQNIGELRLLWEQTSCKLELDQTFKECVLQENKSFATRKSYVNHISIKCATTLQELNNGNCYNNHRNENDVKAPKVAILRCEGSNGDKEMAAAFDSVGFNVYDVMINDLLENPKLLREFRGIAFVGGFSYSDVFGAGVGWATVIKEHSELSQEFQTFYDRQDTFSLGICNGCQLMSELGWIPKCKLRHNTSGRFESRFVRVKILDGKNNVFLKYLANSTLGVWVAHGEGRFDVSTDDISLQTLSPIRYIDDDDNITENYPFNVNGSPFGIAGLSSENGRHFAMMPHPERCFLNWQNPYIKCDSGTNAQENVQHTSPLFTPWSLLFKSVYDWCNNIV